VLDIPLSLSTAPLVDLTINASGDFSIYVIAGVMLGLASGKNPTQAIVYALTVRGVVIFTDFLLNATAFAPLFTSQFQPVREMGWLMASHRTPSELTKASRTTLAAGKRGRYKGKGPDILYTYSSS